MNTHASTGVTASRMRCKARSYRLPLLLLALFLAGPGHAEDRYRVAFGEDASQVRVEACFSGAAPGQLHRHRDAARFTDWIRGPAGRIANRDRNGRLALGKLPDDACIEWQVNLARAAARADYRLALSDGQAIVADGDLWFWRDGERRSLRVDVDLPAGLSVSVPWPELPSAGGRLSFRPESTPAAWPSRTAIGHFETRRIPVGGTEVRLAVLGARGSDLADGYAHWLAETARSVATIAGRFPQHQPQVLVVVVDRQHEPVPWAHVVRGGGVAIEFFVDGTRPLPELRADWTATHEFSHLLLPYVVSDDRWLSEGLASYYQNVLRARNGHLAETQAWEKLHSGFERGQRATHGGSLASATRSGWGATMRIYWSGAAMMLKADAELRARSGGRQSLDSALTALLDCCQDPTRAWRARELFARLDGLTGQDVFARLYREHVPDEEFPDLSETYARLGVIPGSRGLRLDPDAPWGRIRYFIMNDPAFSDAPGARGGR